MTKEPEIKNTLPILRPSYPLKRVRSVRSGSPESQESSARPARLRQRDPLAAFEKYVDDTLVTLKKTVRKNAGRNVPHRDASRFDEELDRLVRDFESRVNGILNRPVKPQRPSILSSLASVASAAVRFSPLGVYRRRFRDVTMWATSDTVDEYGMDVVYEEKVTPIFEFFYKTWWRVDTQGIDNIPASGRVLLVSNHSGAVPWDAAMIKMAVKDDHPTQRELRPLVEDFVYYFPFIGTFMARVGAVRACQENAMRLLKKDQPVLVFPEGIKGVGKLFRERYRLQRFGRGGFITLCIKTHSPLIPVAVVGSEEIYPVLAKSEWLGRLLGMPYFPFTPLFPWLGPLGMIPLPSKWVIQFGEPMDFSEFPQESLDDDILINHLSNRVRTTIQNMLIDLLRRRRSPWFS